MPFNWKQFDLFSKPEDPEVMQVKTTAGAAVSIVSVVIMLWLTVSEFSLYRTTETVDHLKVDDQQQHGGEQFWFDLSIGFPSAKCDSLTYAMWDTKGQEVSLLGKKVDSVPWSEGGLGSNDQGCLLTARMNVPKVAGELKIQAKHVAGMAVAHSAGMDFPAFNSSHTIVHLRFGPVIPGQQFPLNGAVKRAPEGELTAFDYYLQLVPSQFYPLSGRTFFPVLTHQYSVTEFAQKAGVYRGQIVPPSINFKYDFSPIKVHVKEEKRSFLQFVTSICAIIGGVFATSGLINSALFKTSQLFKKPKPGRAAE